MDVEHRSLKTLVDRSEKLCREKNRNEERIKKKCGSSTPGYYAA